MLASDHVLNVDCPLCYQAPVYSNPDKWDSRKESLIFRPPCVLPVVLLQPMFTRMKSTAVTLRVHVPKQATVSP